MYTYTYVYISICIFFYPHTDLYTHALYLCMYLPISVCLLASLHRLSLKVYLCLCSSLSLSLYLSSCSPLFLFFSACWNSTLTYSISLSIPCMHSPKTLTFLGYTNTMVSTCMLVKSEQSEQSHNNPLFCAMFLPEEVITDQNKSWQCLCGKGFFCPLILQFAFSRSFWPPFCLFSAVSSKWRSRFRRETRFFSTSSPQSRSSAHCALLFLQSGGDLKMGFRAFAQKGENSARVSSGHVSRKT